MFIELQARSVITAWKKSLAQAKVRKPEFVPGIPGVPDRKPEPTPAATPSGYRVDDEVRVYLTNLAKLAPKTYRAYKRSLELFQDSCKKIYVHQISKQDLQKFDTDLMEQGDEDRNRSWWGCLSDACLRSYPVSTRINHVANDDEGCSSPVELAETQNQLFS